MRNNRFVLFICFLFCLEWGITVSAQPPTLLHFTTEDGLPSNTVYNIFRDSRGLLWFGTDKGVAVYNGISFRHLTTGDGLPDNDVFSFIEDGLNRIWISTYSGRLCYYKDGVFHTPYNTSFLKLPFRDIQHSQQLQSNGGLIINYMNAGKFVDICNNTVKILDIAHIDGTLLTVEKNSSQYRLIFENKIVETDAGLRISKVINFPGNCKLLAGNILLSDSSFSSLSGKFLYPVVGKIRSMRKDESKAGLISNGHFFLGTYDGLFIDQAIHLLKGVRITNICQDVNGNYWVSAINEGGIYCLPCDFDQVKKLDRAYSGIVNNAGIVNDELYFTTETGSLYKYANNETTLLHASANIIAKSRSVINPHEVFLFAYSGKCLYGRGNPVRFVATNKVGPDWGFLRSTLYSKGKIWAVHHNTLMVIETSITAYTAMQRSVDTIYADGDQRIYSPVLDEKEQIWFSTLKGLYKIQDRSPLLQKEVSFRQFAFLKDYVVGYTERNELLALKPGSDAQHTDTFGNAGCIWNKIFPAGKERLIITTDRKSRLLAIMPDGKMDCHVIENPFIPESPEHVFTNKDTCYFFKNGSITIVPLKLLMEPAPAPQVILTGLRAGNRSFLTDSIVALDYNIAKNILLSFTPLSFSSREITCEYSIAEDQLTDQWIKVEGDQINIAELGSGRHYIKLRARTLSSGYSAPVMLTLVVARPFWETWWFIGCCAAIFTSVFVFIVRGNTRRLLKKKQKEFQVALKMQQSEYKALNSLMNPHFIFNSLNNIQSLVNKEDKETANKYLVVFSKMIRQNMLNVAKEKVAVRRELELVENYLKLEKLRFKDRFDYRLNISEMEELDDVMIPALLLQPLVENSIKHGLLPKKQDDNVVYIDVYKSGQYLYLTVGDNGIGFKETGGDQGHESFALSNIRERIAHFNSLYKQEVILETRNVINEGIVTGTIATIKINLHNRS